MKRLLITGVALLSECYYPPPYSVYPDYMRSYYGPMGPYTYQPPSTNQPPSYVPPGQPEPGIVSPPLTGGEQPPLGNDGPINLTPTVQQTPLGPPASASIPPDEPPHLESPIQPSLPSGSNNVPAPAPFQQPPAEEQRPVNPALEVPDEHP